MAQAQAVSRACATPYDQAYYAGIISERRAKAHRSWRPRSGYVAYDLFRQAMGCYEKAQRSGRPGNDDAVLRWNTCARILMRHPNLNQRPRAGEPPLE